MFRSPRAGGRVASLLFPPLVVSALLYQGLAALQIPLARMETLIVIGASLTLAFLAGCLAAFGRDWLRILILSGVTVLLLDMTLFPSRLLDHVTSPRRRPPVADLR